MQIKTTRSYHFTSTRMTIIKINKIITSVDENIEKLEPSCTADQNVKEYG